MRWPVHGPREVGTVARVVKAPVAVLLRLIADFEGDGEAGLFGEIEKGGFSSSDGGESTELEGILALTSGRVRAVVLDDPLRGPFAGRRTISD